MSLFITYINLNTYLHLFRTPISRISAFAGLFLGKLSCRVMVYLFLPLAPSSPDWELLIGDSLDREPLIGDPMDRQPLIGGWMDRAPLIGGSPDRQPLIAAQYLVAIL